MIILALLLLTLVQLLAGLGLIALFNPGFNRLPVFPLALLLGIAFFSFIPFLLQLLFIPLTAANLCSSLLAGALLLNLCYKRSMRLLRGMLRYRPAIRLYEWPFLLLIAFIFFVSAWRCYYYPPLPRDLTSGAEVIAEYAVKEHSLINSVFTVDLSSTNNPFKPAFISSLQVIYKLAGIPFGQVWLSAVFLCFIVLLYRMMTRLLHPLLAGALLLCFLAIPEMYAYTIMVLFDYSNAVFFFLSVYFLCHYLEKSLLNDLVFAGLLMGIATYIRSETLILACFFIPLLFFKQKHAGMPVIKAVCNCVLLVLPSVLLYLLSITLYLNCYVPVSYGVGTQLNHQLMDTGPFFTRLYEMTTKLLLGAYSYVLYGGFVLLFLFFFIADALLTRLKFSPGSRLWLYAIAVVYFGYPFLGYLLPLLDLENSTKRGLFKLFPLMLFYLGHNPLLIRLSAWLESRTAGYLPGVAK